MSWRDEANAAIAKAHALLPSDCSLEDRIKAIDAAYPFGLRQFHPYKIWLDARRKYLIRFGFKSKSSKANRGHLSPLERMMLRAKEKSE